MRFDGGRATYVHALIPSTAYNDAVAWYAGRLGPPNNQWERAVTFLGGRGQPNPTVAWRGIEQVSQEIVVMEIRKYDDTRGGFPDARHGAIILSRPGADPIFPQLSSVELMALRISEGPRPIFSSSAAETIDVPTAATIQPEVPVPASNPMPPSVLSVPPEPAPAPRLTGANPFDPETRIGTALKPSTVEEPANSPSVQSSEPMPADEAPSSDVAESGPLSQIANFFQAGNRHLYDEEKDKDDSTLQAGATTSEDEQARPDDTNQSEAAKTPPAAQPRLGFFGRLANSFDGESNPVTNDVSTIAPMRIRPVLTDVTLTLGDGFELGRTLLDSRRQDVSSDCREL